MKRRPLLLLFRVVAAGALVLYLLHHAPLHELRRALAHAADHPLWLTAGLGATLMGLCMGAARWTLMLRAHGFRLPGPRVFHVFFIGQFFNSFMPGACGGDVARAYYAARDFPEKRTEAASTVFADRALGLLAIVAFCCMVIVLRLPFFLTHPTTRWPGLLMLLFLVGSVAGLLVLFWRNLFEHWPLFRRIEHNTALGPWIRRAYDSFYTYRHHPATLYGALALSLLNLFFLTLACLCFASALDIELAHPFVTHFTLFPIITILAAVPLTPGALGWREGLFAGMYASLGVDPAFGISLSLLVYGGGLIWSLLGGFFFVNHTHREHVGLRNELNALQEKPGD